eukprot:TRINITY_DN60291_c0_g1_i1.p1 TRINITY_DN60291_c0_g1~~TRINITY_DN60291_c0_g1_i1.p1  ORF type:complete len:264 (-),score=33.30 TRINITY_DN60291_c0_g1_i1:38-829(-)
MAAVRAAPFGNRAHPNAVVARREQERQEQARLRRLSEVKTTTPGAALPPSGPKPPSRAGSVGRMRPASRPGSARPNSRPPSAVGMRSCEFTASTAAGGRASSASRPASASRPRPPAALSPDEVQQQLLQYGLGPYHMAAAAAAAAADTARARRSRSETGPRIQASFMTSPQRRYDDARNNLPANSEAERKALLEELQGWYFSLPSDGQDLFEDKGSMTKPGMLPARPPVILLEEAVAAVKARPNPAPFSVGDMAGLNPYSSSA